MLKRDLSAISALLNEQVDNQEDLHEYLIKAEALAQVAITTEFFELGESTMYNFLWILSDVIIRAKELNERSLGDLLKKRPI